MDKREMIGQIRMCIDKSQYGKGIKIAEKAIGIMPTSPVVHNLMGVLLENQNCHVQAIQQYKVACELDMSYGKTGIDKTGGAVSCSLPDFISLRKS